VNLMAFDFVCLSSFLNNVAKIIESRMR
jgi:hypothetical protein